jgi:hypothetical protein
MSKDFRIALNGQEPGHKTFHCLEDARSTIAKVAKVNLTKSDRITLDVGYYDVSARLPIWTVIERHYA